MVKRLFAVSPDLYGKIGKELERVEANIVPVTAELQIVDDSLFRIKPSKSDCLNGIISYMQLANYTNYGKILLQKQLFENPKLSNTDKASLFIHEAVYAFLRTLGDTDSVRARKVVGLLFSTLSTDDLKKELEKVLSGSAISGPNSEPWHPSVPTGMNFVTIQPGTFMMGSPANEPGRDADETQHLVTLTHGFEMQTTTVTQAQWVQVMGNNPSSFQSANYCPRTFTVMNGIPMCPNNPVERVSWVDAQRYLIKLNMVVQDGYFYRLPTESEWEYAARSGTQTAFFHGNDSARLLIYGWYGSNSGGQTHEVASLRPNPWGLYDMSGNVWQWVSDNYGIYPSSAVTDPVGPTNGISYTIRGGDCKTYSHNLRSASRYHYVADARRSDLGFRLVRTRL